MGEKEHQSVDELKICCCGHKNRLLCLNYIIFGIWHSKEEVDRRFGEKLDEGCDEAVKGPIL